MEIDMPSLREEQVIDEFQRRRKRLLQYFGFCILLIMFGLVILQFIEGKPTFLGIRQMAWKSFAATQLVIAVLFGVKGYWQYRCPVCNEIVKGHDKFYLGVLTDPERCPHCGSKLRD
jgi:DNA-directed RNA polymerase subunit RPC12/RpoP